MVKHAQTTQATVKIIYTKTKIDLEIIDDGIGFNEETAKRAKLNHHLGLRSMQKRIELLQGEFEIISKMNEGTIIKIVIPVENIPTRGILIMSRTLKILLADDHSILRTGLKLLLSTQKDFKVVAEASNGKEVLSLLDDGLEVDVILLDLSMPVMSGLDCLRELNKRQSISSINVLVLTMHNEQQYIKEVMLLGAKGYLRKDTLDTELFKALRTLAEGRRYLAENDANSLLDSLMYIPPKKESLSSREEEVLNYIVRGYSLSDIAQKLCLSVKTISTYKTRIMTKLNCKQNSDLVNYALKNNILDKY